jgi:hypothetical protein
MPRQGRGPSVRRPRLSRRSELPPGARGFPKCEGPPAGGRRGSLALVGGTSTRSHGCRGGLTPARFILRPADKLFVCHPMLTQLYCGEAFRGVNRRNMRAFEGGGLDRSKRASDLRRCSFARTRKDPLLDRRQKSRSTFCQQGSTMVLDRARQSGPCEREKQNASFQAGHRRCCRRRHGDGRNCECGGHAPEWWARLPFSCSRHRQLVLLTRSLSLSRLC